MRRIVVIGAVLAGVAVVGVWWQWQADALSSSERRERLAALDGVRSVKYTFQYEVTIEPGITTDQISALLTEASSILSSADDTEAYPMMWVKAPDGVFYVDLSADDQITAAIMDTTVSATLSDFDVKLTGYGESRFIVEKRNEVLARARELLSDFAEAGVDDFGLMDTLEFWHAKGLLPLLELDPAVANVTVDRIDRLTRCLRRSGADLAHAEIGDGDQVIKVAVPSRSPVDPVADVFTDAYGKRHLETHNHQGDCYVGRSGDAAGIGGPAMSPQGRGVRSMSSGPTRILALSLVAVTTAPALSGCSDDATAQSPNLEIVEVRPLDLPPGDAYLSPDGNRIATYAGKQLCVHTAEGDKVRCADHPIELDPNSVQWNPDGSRLLYTEDFWSDYDDDLEVEAGETRQEPDIWSFQAGSGQVTDLTDDGVDPADVDLRNQPRNDQAVDTLPMWIDDSTIRFFRSDDGWNTVAVMQMPAAGGKPEQVGTLRLEFPPESVAYSPDGEHAAYERQVHYHDIVRSSLHGRDVETIVDGSTLYTISFSSDGSDALAVPFLSDFDPSNPSSHAWEPPVAMSVDGAATELDEEVQWAAWRPSGDGLIYAEFDEHNDLLEFPLRIVSDVNDVGDDARELSDRSFLPPFLHADLRAPVWSEQNTMLLREQTDEANEFRYVLVHLGAA